MQSFVQEILTNPTAFLRFMKENRYPVIHDSNLFFRDIEFALAKWMTVKTGRSVEYFGSVEHMAQDLCAGMERAGVLKKVSRNAYLVQAQEFMLPRPEPAVKPAAAPPAAAQPAVA